MTTYIPSQSPFESEPVEEANVNEVFFSFYYYYFLPLSLLMKLKLRGPRTREKSRRVFLLVII